MDFKILKGFVPDLVIKELEQFGEGFGVTTNLRLAHLLSQLDHESGGWKYKIENLNYSEKRLLEVFPKYFDSTNALYYARKPEKIANRVYASRGGNGDEKSGEPWKFIGRGYIQLTLKNNYIAFGKAIGQDLVSNPDKVRTHYPLTSALWFFQTNNLWKICDEGTSDEVVKKLTKKINGAYNGLKDRLAKFGKYKKLLGI